MSGLVGALSRRTARTDEWATCPRCTVDYRARLTRWHCPVCGADAPGAPAGALPRMWSDPDTRVLAIVAGATIINLLLLAVLVLVVLS